METLFQMFILLHKKIFKTNNHIKSNFLMEICLSLTLAKLNFYLK